MMNAVKITTIAMMFLTSQQLLKADANKTGMGEPSCCNVSRAGMISKAKKVKLSYGPLHYGKRQDSAMQKWRENRFGQFIHWGLYSIPGGVWKGKTYNYAAEFLKSSARIPGEEWNALSQRFNPVEFSGREWAAMAKELGVKYVCLTTKHHEGFCLWPTKYTDFNITNTPFKKDLMKEFVDAYTEAGIDVYLYYSVLDWHHPDWRYDIKSEGDKVAFERFKLFVKNQLVELVENYPSTKGLWFDGTWDRSWKKNGRFSYELEKLLKEKRKGLIVNSRMRADDFGSRHFDSNRDLMGDYESGYERRVPDPNDTSVLKNDWECCMTVPENQWGYHKDWSLSYVKTPNELIEMMSLCTSLSGNFLLNFGPKGDGSFREQEMNLVKSIGSWMKVNGEAIYGCGHSGLKKQDWGYFTRNEKTGKLYMIVFNVPVTGLLKVKHPKNRKLSAKLIKDGGSLEVRRFDSDETFVVLKEKGFTDPFVIAVEMK